MSDMTSDQELLVQRFLDQELSPDERIRFLSQLGRHEALRQRTIEMEQLLVDVSRLPRPHVPNRFAERVLERAAPGVSLAARITRVLFAGRELRWNLAGAAAVACVVLLATGSLLTLNPPPAAVASSPAVLVRLVVFHPGARTVQVAGDFNGWNPSSTPLEEAAGGAWIVTIALEPGRYEYMYVIDGQQWIADPFALEHSEDGFGSRNAVLDVRPPAEPLGAL